MCEWCDYKDSKWLLHRSLHWSVYLADVQDYIGRCILVLNRHCGSLSELNNSEWIELKTIIDRLEFVYKEVLGADRQIGDIFIQTKYYNSARGSLEACFNPETGQYRYMSDGKPMQLEVPKDQYEKVVEGFRRKIENGKVPGVTDPNEAANIVRKRQETIPNFV